MQKIILVSGGFDPPHVGHIRMFREAAEWGQVVVAINSDDWLMRKKGYVFMPWEERAELIAEFASVSVVSSFDDSDDTACDAIRKFRPAAFANGGDRKKENTPEMELCDELGVQMLWGIGGKDKPQSSSWLVNNLMEKK
jgi:D-beta-D-heptose 7-phosphate kinase/D-beta-D-heptose 1-phosphate adenosyltransferase|tara:strand:- start:111 stop:527 length:417 start_codon:yes stop_codon:yes gene_type:complete